MTRTDELGIEGIMRRFSGMSPAGRSALNIAPHNNLSLAGAKLGAVRRSIKRNHATSDNKILRQINKNKRPCAPQPAERSYFGPLWWAVVLLVIALIVKYAMRG